MSLLVQEFRQKVSKLKDHNMKQEANITVGYSTGFLAFDFRNGTIMHSKRDNQEYKYYSVGITDGSMVMIIGRSGCGKTTWTIQASANLIRPFKTSSIFHDNIEGGLSTSRLQQLTKFSPEELDSRYIARDAGINAENFYERIRMIYDIKNNDRTSYEYDTMQYDYRGNRVFKLEPTVYILDSLAMLMPGKFAEEEELSGQMSATATAKANAMVFKRIVPMLKAANIILMVINHINQKVDINPMQRTKAQVSYLKQGETLPGGNAPIYLANNMIRFDDNSKLKESDGFGIDGSIVDVGLVKSRTNKAGQVAKLVFNQETGFDEELSLLVLLKDHGRINGAGAFLYIGDRSDFKFSQKKFKEKLSENQEFKQIFMDEVKDVLSQIIPDKYYAPPADTVEVSTSILADMNSGMLAV